ncbi:hypothetical protein T484DRAFT_1857659 [Baffinella frigidus]|nr:hypothetical protein T484DRAFT_1857659 [Cryptophyta sp. CCMP2293]
MVSRTSGLLLGLLPLTAAFAPASLLPGLRAASGASSLQACRTPLRAQAPRAAFSRSAALRMQDGEKKEEMVLITGNWQKKSPTEVSSMLAADPDLMYIDVRYLHP